MWPERFSCKEDGSKRDFSALVGRMKVSAEFVTKRKAQKSTGSTIAQKSLKEGVHVAKRYCVTHLLNASQWKRGHFSMKKWVSEKHERWCMPAEGFRGHVATDSSLLGCRWQVVSMWLVSGAVGL